MSFSFTAVDEHFASYSHATQDPPFLHNFTFLFRFFFVLPNNFACDHVLAAEGLFPFGLWFSKYMRGAEMLKKKKKTKNGRENV